MLSGLLKNDIAVEVSIHIMTAFVEMRKFIKNNSVIFDRLVEHELRLIDMRVVLINSLMNYK